MMMNMQQAPHMAHGLSGPFMDLFASTVMHTNTSTVCSPGPPAVRNWNDLTGRPDGSGQYTIPFNPPPPRQMEFDFMNENERRMRERQEREARRLRSSMRSRYHYDYARGMQNTSFTSTRGVHETPTGPPVAPEPPRPSRWVCLLLWLQKYAPWLFAPKQEVEGD